jgi:hypothetical protein
MMVWFCSSPLAPLEGALAKGGDDFGSGAARFVIPIGAEKEIHSLGSLTQKDGQPIPSFIGHAGFSSHSRAQYGSMDAGRTVNIASALTPAAPFNYIRRIPQALIHGIGEFRSRFFNFFLGEVTGHDC